MPHSWAFALSISALQSVIIWRILGPVRAFDRFEKMLLLAMLFPCPIWYAMSSGNSMVFLSDAAAPLVLTRAIQKRRLMPRKLGPALIALVLAGGVIPLFISLTGSRERMEILFDFQNAYRMVGVVSLIALLSATRWHYKNDQERLLHTLGVTCCTLAISMMLQGFGGVPLNVFDDLRIAVDSSYTKYAIDKDNRFIVLGLFRGCIGVMALTGPALFMCVRSGSLKIKAVSTIYGTAGLTAIILAGAKTCLGACLAATLAAIVIGCRPWRTFFPLALAIGFITYVYISPPNSWLDALIPDQTLIVIRSAGRETSTFDEREQKWEDAQAQTTAHPEILLGILPPDVNSTPFYYHNEYVAAVMVGGVWSAALYFGGLLTLALLLWRAHGRAPSDLRRLSLITFCGAAVQSFAGSHLVPTHMYGQSAILVAATYGCALASQTTSSAPHPDEASSPGQALAKARLHPTCPIPRYQS